MKKLLITIGCVSSLAGSTAAEGLQISEPIEELEKASLTEAAMKEATVRAPVLIESKEAAKKYLSGDTLKKVQTLDFTKKKVIAFFWRGSGQDKLEYVVAESFPEQIMFSLKRGRTRDLRQHSKVYILRKNVSYNPPN